MIINLTLLAGNHSLVGEQGPAGSVFYGSSPEGFGVFVFKRVSQFPVPE